MVVENRKYVYNESNQLSEAVLCDGRRAGPLPMMMPGSCSPSRRQRAAAAPVSISMNMT